jgi:hypothetical protein
LKGEAQETEEFVVSQPDIQGAAAVFEETLAINENAIEELDENIESAEKRFCSFIEKSLAPVMDGLYSGKKHGESLRDEFKESAFEHADYAKNFMFMLNCSSEALFVNLTSVLYSS